jgi:hypothetical protein
VLPATGTSWCIAVSEKVSNFVLPFVSDPHVFLEFCVAKLHIAGEVDLPHCDYSSDSGKIAKSF